MSAADEREWGAYNAAQTERAVRTLAHAAAHAARGDEGRLAVELGCGIGREAEFLARAGWIVHTFDADDTVVTHLDELAQALPITHVQARLEDLITMPACDLLLACGVLPFIPRARFSRLWHTICETLNPGGIIAVDFFGDKDDWGKGHGTFFTRAEIDGLIEGFDVVSLVESEWEGSAFSGPKHWHTYTLVARALPSTRARRSRYV